MFDRCDYDTQQGGMLSERRWSHSLKEIAIKEDLERISMPMRKVNFEGILLGLDGRKMGTTWGKIPAGETVNCSGCVSWSKALGQVCMTVGRSLCPIGSFLLRGHLLCLEDGHLITLKHAVSIFSIGTNSVFWQKLKATARTACIIFRAEHEMKM